MPLEQVQIYFEQAGLGDRVKVLDQSSATVELAAQALGCQAREIAKTMSFYLEDGPVLIITAGDAKIDNRKYKDFFHQKARMIPWEEVEEAVGHAPGGVCPFARKPGVGRIWMCPSSGLPRCTPPRAAATARWSSPWRSWRSTRGAPAGWTCARAGRRSPRAERKRKPVRHEPYRFFAFFGQSRRTTPLASQR